MLFRIHISQYNVSFFGVAVNRVLFLLLFLITVSTINNARRVKKNEKRENPNQKTHKKREKATNSIKKNTCEKNIQELSFL